MSEPGNPPRSQLPAVSGLQRITSAIRCSVMPGSGLSAIGAPPKDPIFEVAGLAQEEGCWAYLGVGDPWNYWWHSLEGPGALGMGK